MATRLTQYTPPNSLPPHPTVPDPATPCMPLILTLYILLSVILGQTCLTDLDMRYQCRRACDSPVKSMKDYTVYNRDKKEEKVEYLAGCVWFYEMRSPASTVWFLQWIVAVGGGKVSASDEDLSFLVRMERSTEGGTFELFVRGK